MSNGPISPCADPILPTLPAGTESDREGLVELYWNRPPRPHPAGAADADSLPALWIDLGGGG